jgi:hypothetical protein
MKRFPAHHKQSILKICEELKEIITKSNNSHTAKTLSIIAIDRIKTTVINEYKNANSFLQIK